MTIKEKRPIKISFPFSLYFKQLFTADTYVRYINPFSFWRRYRINHLETCRELDTVEYLERCLQIKWRSPKLLNSRDTKNFTGTATFTCLTEKQVVPNKTFIFQPSIKLKYRGVTYHTKQVLIMNINNNKIVPDVAELNSREQPANSNSMNTTEISNGN